MAQVQGEEIYLAHSGQEVDDNIDEVVAARGSEASLSARLADIVSDFEVDQQRQDAVTADKWGYIRGTIGGTGDFNTVVSSGYYRYNGSPANAPTGANGEFGVLMVFAAGSYISQIAHCFLSSQYGIYIRSSTNTGSTWTAWLKLEGTQPATAQSSAASLMQAGRLDPAELTDAERIDAEQAAAEPEEEADA